MNAEQREFEQSLQRLQPVEPELNVAELMFRAGQDAARRESRRQLRRWQFSTLATSLCALAAVVTHWPGGAATTDRETSVANRGSGHSSVREVPQNNVEKRTSPENEQQSLHNVPVVVSAEEPLFDPQPLTERRSPLFDWWNRTSAVSVTAEDSYLNLRNRVLRDGVDALPEPDLGSGSGSGETLTSSPLKLRDAWDQDLWNQI